MLQRLRQILAFFVLPLIYALLLPPGLVHALPVDGQVEAGTAVFNSPAANILNVTTSDQVIINWRSFNIDTHETVNFIQPAVTSMALNRVLGGGPSIIAGALHANGGVILVNPSGIDFRPTAMVNVGALIASSVNISSQDFLAGHYRFVREGAEPVGMVMNEGKILAVRDGFILLLGGAVGNTGSLTAELGRVALASGDTFIVTITDNKLIAVAVDKALQSQIVLADGTTLKDAVSNKGLISAPGGKVELKAKTLSNIFDRAVNQEGVVEVDSMVDHAGAIELVADTGLVRNAGALHANGTFDNPDAGSILISGGTAIQAGLLKANAFDLGRAGKAEIYSQHGTWLLGGSVTEAKADGFRGTGGDVRVNAWEGNTYFHSGALIDVSGGGFEGDAGFIELSAGSDLRWNGSLRGVAQNGFTGARLLLDPLNIILNSTTQTAPTNNANGTPDVGVEDAPTAGTTTIQINDVKGFSELYLQAIQDITVDSALSMSNNNSVRFEAGRDIAINANLSASGTGTITLTADAAFAGRPSDGIGTLTMASGKSISSGSGAIQITAAQDVAVASISSSSGNVTVTSSAGSINDDASDSNADITGATVTLTANASGKGIGISNGSLDTDATTLVLDVGTGGINIADTGSVTLNAPTIAAGGSLTLSADIALTLPSSNLDLGAGSISFASNGGDLTTAGTLTASTGSIGLSASGNLYINHNVSTTSTGTLALTADNDASGAGTLTVATGIMASTSDQPITITAANFVLTGTGAINAGAGDVTVKQAKAATLGIGTGTGTFSISDTEIDQITTTGTLTIGDAGLASVVVADGVTAGSKNLSITTNSTINDSDDTGDAIVTSGTLTLRSNGIIGGANTQGLNVDVGALNITDTNGKNITITDSGTNGGTALTTVATGGAGAISYTLTSGDISVGSITTTGTVALTASAGNINDNASDSTADITGSTLTLTANAPGKGIGVSNGSLDTDATTLVLNVGTGGINIADIGSVTLNTPTIAAGGSIAVSAATTLTLPGANLSIGAGSITFSSNGGNLSTNGTLTTSTGNIALSASGNLTVADDISTTSSGTVTLTADSDGNGTGTFSQGSGDSVTTTNAGILITVGNASTGGGDASVRILDAGSGAITVISRGGSILEAAAGASSLTGGTVTLTAPSGTIGTSSNAINTAATTLVLTAGSTGATVVNTGNTALNASTLSAGASLNVSSTNGLTIAGNQTITGSGTITLNSDSDSNASGDLAINTGVTLSTVNQAISLTGHDLIINGTGAVDAGSAGVTLAPSTATTLGIGSGTGTFHVSNAEIGQISTTGTLTIGSSALASAVVVDGVTAGSKNLSITTNSTINDSDDTGDAISTGGTLTLRSNGIIGGANTQGLNVDVAALNVTDTNGQNVTITDSGANGGTTLSSVATGGAGAIAYTLASGDITVGSVATTGTVALTASAGNVNDDASDATADITGSTLTLTANASGKGIGISNGSLDTNAATLVLNAGTAGINIADTGSVTLNAPTIAAGGSITVSAATTLTLPSANLSLGAGNISFTSSGGTLSTQGTLTTSSGNISLSASSNLNVDHNVSTTGTGTITFTADSDASGAGTFAISAGVTASTADQQISITADGVTINGTASINAGAGNIVLKPSTAISIGIGSGAGTFSINDAEIDQIVTTGTLVLGDSALASAVIVDGLTAGSKNLLIATNSTINDSDDTGDAVVTSGTLSLRSNGIIGGANAQGVNVDVGTLNIVTTGGNNATIRDSGVNGGTTLSSVATGGAGTINYTLVSGDVSVGAVSTTGNVALAASAGNINDDTSDSTADITGSTLTLTANASGKGIGVNNGSLDIDAATVVLDVGSGGSTLANVGAGSLALNASTLASGASLNVTSKAGLTVAGNQAATGVGTITLNADSDANGTGTLTINTGVTVSTADQTITMTGNDIVINGTGSVNAGAGNVTLTPAAAVSMGIGTGAGTFSVSDAEIDAITTTGTLTIGSTGLPGAASAVVDGVTAGSKNLSIITTGSIDDSDDTGDAISTTGALTLRSVGPIGSSNGSQGLNIDVGTLSVTYSGGHPVTIRDSGANGGTTFLSAAAFSLGALNYTLVDGDLLVGSIAASSIALTASNGNINDDGNDSSADITTGTLTLTANASGKGVGVSNGSLDTDVTTLVLNTGSGGATINEASGVDLAASTLGGALSLTAGGAITDSGTLVITGDTTLAAGTTNDITLDSAANNFSAVGITSGKNVTLVDTNAIDLKASTVSGTLSVTAGGAITDSGTLAITGDTTLAAGTTNDITLDSAANNFSAVGITSGKNVTLVDTNAIDLKASTVSGTLSVTAGGAITDSGTLVVTGDTTLAAGTTNDITLDSAANNFSAVGITSGKNVTLVDTNAIDLKASTVSGTLSVTAGGAITDSGTLAITGDTTLAAGTTNDITLDSAANNFSAVGITSGKNVTLVDTNAIDLKASTVSGTLSVTAGGAITDSGTLAITGDTTLAAGATNDITLDSAANNFSAVGITSGKNVTLVDTNALDLKASTVSGILSVTAGGAIADSGTLAITGDTTLAAGTTNDITLDSAANNFSAVGITSGKNVTLVDTNALDLKASTVSGTLSVTAGGAITDSGTLAITGDTTLAAGATNDITLDSAANNFSAVGITSGKNVTLVDTNALDLKASTVSGTLSVTAGGAITDSGTLVITGDTTLAAGATNDITLDSAANNFSAVGITSGKNVTLVDTNAITLKTSTLSGAFTVTAGGTLTVEGINAGGAVQWTTTQGDILDGNGALVNVTAGANSSLTAASTIGTILDPLDVSITGTLDVSALGQTLAGDSVMISGTTSSNTLIIVGNPPGKVYFNGVDLRAVAPAPAPVSNSSQETLDNATRGIFGETVEISSVGPQNDISASFRNVFSSSQALIKGADFVDLSRLQE